MKKRKIAVYTGGRTEYGILRPIIKKILSSKKLELQLVVSAVHFIKKFGSTYTFIEQDKLPIANQVKMTMDKEMGGKMGLEVANGIAKLTKVFLKLKPDIVLVAGDRSETLAAAVAAALLPVPVAHTHGGDVSRAGIDESMRHAITKLAHIHLAATEKARERIIQMGENPANVFWVGSPGLDDFVNSPTLEKELVEKKLRIKIADPLLVILQHPVTTAVTTAAVEIKETLRAVASLPGTKVVIYPNGDPGSEAMIEEIEKFRDKEGFYIFKSIERFLYINLLRCARVLIGNSSGGIIETASIPIPAVNIGPRQTGRERNANILDVDYDQTQIKKAIEKCLTDKQFLHQVAGIKNLWGDGTASTKIVKILETIRLDQNLLQKHFHVAKN